MDETRWPVELTEAAAEFFTLVTYSMQARVRTECRRRAQRVPKIRLPARW